MLVLFIHFLRVFYHFFPCIVSEQVLEVGKHAEMLQQMKKKQGTSTSSKKLKLFIMEKVKSCHRLWLV